MKKEQGVYKFKTQPYQHQLDVFLRSRDQEFFAHLLEMGTGKSKILLDEAGYLYDTGKIDSLLIMSNKGSYLNWVDTQIPLHLPDHIPRYVTYWDSNASAKHDRTYEELFKFNGGLRILVANIETLAYDRGRKFIEMFARGRCLGCIDESTSIGNPKALRTKAAMILAKTLKYRRIMTGSPIANGPLKMYSQAQFLKNGLLGHTSFYSYRNEFCILKDMVLNQGARLLKFKTVVGYKNIDKLKEKVKPWSAIITKAECLDLPPKVYETCEVELTPEQLKIYTDLRDECVAELSDGSMIAVNIVLTKLLRLQQVLCGYLPNEDEKMIKIKEKRIDRLMEILEETSGKVIIWSRFVQSIKDIAEAIGKEYGRDSVIEYYGSTSMEDRRAGVTEFQEGKARFFIGNQQTGGYGVTLTAASTVIYFANSFDLEVRLQSEDRCHRVGQTKSVTYIDLQTKNTVDEKIVKTLQAKKKISDVLMSPDGWKDLL